MKGKHLSLKQRLLVAATLFGMFFGAGNLIFPVHLGQLAGHNLVPATVGFILTAVGIPILGVAAIGNTHSDGLQALASRVGGRYGCFFTCLLYLTIGPCFAIPRCATTSFTTGIAPMLGNAVSERMTLFLFSAVFFALVLLFSLRPGNITLWIGKIINPLFLFFLGILIVSALLHPGAPASATIPDASYQSGALFQALSEGYGTMDAIAGLAFGIIVINVIRQMGVQNDEVIAGEVLHSGILAGILMALIYMLTILIGAQSLGLFTAIGKRRHCPVPDFQPLPGAGRNPDPGCHHHLCLLKDLHRPGNQLRGNLRKNVSAPAFLYRLGCAVHRVFFPDLKRRTFHHHPLFRAGADADLPSGHRPDPAGTVRKGILTMTARFISGLQCSPGALLCLTFSKHFQKNYSHCSTWMRL